MEIPVPSEIICQAASLDSIGSFCGGSNRLQELFLPPCTFHLLPPSIFLIVSFSSHPLVASPQPSPPSTSFLCVPLFLCPSLSLPGACLSGSVPVCLFADDSTWSRCDAQQLLLCSPASPPPPYLSLSLPLYLSATPPYLSLSPQLLYLSLPPLQCLLCSYLHVFLFPAPSLLGSKLASLILCLILRSVFFLFLSTLTSLTNSFHFCSLPHAAVNVQSILGFLYNNKSGVCPCLSAS